MFENGKWCWNYSFAERFASMGRRRRRCSLLEWRCIVRYIRDQIHRLYIVIAACFFATPATIPVSLHMLALKISTWKRLFLDSYLRNLHRSCIAAARMKVEHMQSGTLRVSMLPASLGSTMPLKSKISSSSRY